MQVQMQRQQKCLKMAQMDGQGCLNIALREFRDFINRTSLTRKNKMFTIL